MIRSTLNGPPKITEVLMELIARTVNLRTLTISELDTIEAGALFPWPALLAGIGVACMTNIPEVIGGMIDGWNAYH